MITEDDARNTIELADRYVIQPSFGPFGLGDGIQGRPVPENFRYASDTNTDWLDAEALRKLVD
jgi:UDP-N-acetylglucosamine 4,6-dehydratase